MDLEEEVIPKKRRLVADILASSSSEDEVENHEDSDDDEDDEHLLAGIESPPPSAATLDSDSSPGVTQVSTVADSSSPYLATQPLVGGVTDKKSKKKSNSGKKSTAMDSLAALTNDVPIRDQKQDRTFTLSHKTNSQEARKEATYLKAQNPEIEKENRNIEVVELQDSPIPMKSQLKKNSEGSIPTREVKKTATPKKKSISRSKKSPKKGSASKNLACNKEDTIVTLENDNECDDKKNQTKPTNTPEAHGKKTSEKKRTSLEKEESSNTSSALPPTTCTEPVQKKARKMSFQDKVFQYMLLACKPFTLKSLAEPLKTTDTALNHLMLSLVDKGLVVTKDFEKKGRVKTLYWANHDGRAKEVSAALATPKERKEAEAEFAELQSKKASLDQSLRTLSGELSNDDLERELQEEKEALEKVQDQLVQMKQRIRNANAPVQSKLQRGPMKSAAQLAKERCPRRLAIRINNMRGEWKTRKDKCTDFIEVLADGMDKKPKDVCKLLDIETDEEVGAKMPLRRTV